LRSDARLITLTLRQPKPLARHEISRFEALRASFRFPMQRADKATILPRFPIITLWPEMFCRPKRPLILSPVSEELVNRLPCRTETDFRSGRGSRAVADAPIPSWRAEHFPPASAPRFLRRSPSLDYYSFSQDPKLERSGRNGQEQGSFRLQLDAQGRTGQGPRSGRHRQTQGSRTRRGTLHQGQPQPGFTPWNQHQGTCRSQQRRF
jgi:hypothetical protein